MRCLERNKEIVYYALYNGKTAVVDSNGDATGEYTVSYGNVIKTRQNVSPARQFPMVDGFGINNDYSKTIVTDDVTTQYDTDTVYWIGFGSVDQYLPTRQYAVGSMCIYSGKLYLCKAVTTGEFAPASWLEAPHNYIVQKVAKSLTGTTLAVKEVKKQ